MTSILAGEIVCVGTYFNGKVDAITFRDKAAGGQRRTAYTIRETILTEKDPIIVARFMRDDEKPDQWKPSAKKGDKCFVKIQNMNIDKGTITLNGVIETLV